jgi:NADPH:quinone reductase-like Zn-dependent oxidoreductase
MEGPSPVRDKHQVLILGTGGVSLFALQIASAAGARTVVVSSSDDKLQRARALGADCGINYTRQPEWGSCAAELAEPNGFNHILEVGGSGTLRQSLQAVGYSGEIAMIGALTPYTEGPDCTLPLKLKSASLRGIIVGSRIMTERFVNWAHQHRIRPVIDRVYPFEQAAEAYDYQASKELFGKVVISLS